MGYPAHAVTRGEHSTLSLCTVLTDTVGESMAKNHRKKTSQPLPSQPDARKELSARVAKTLRSVEAAKLRNNLLQIYNEANHAEETAPRNRSRRPAPRRSDTPSKPRLHIPSVNALSSPRLSSQVRDELLSGVRLLSCVRRHVRKEALFALRRIGQGKKGRRIRTARWTDKSYLRCK